MARPLRLEVPGGLYHVMSRGNERRDIFLDDTDRRRFLLTLQLVTERLNVLCHSYCLMPNHYHLLIETPDGNISSAIRQLNGVYAQWFNHCHERVGHLFQGRFTSKLVDKDSYLLAVSRYIARNPVRACLVAHPSGWEWSSYRALSGLTKAPPFLHTDWLLQCFGVSDRAIAEKSFREFVDDSPDDSDLLDVGPILGSDDFKNRLRGDLDGVASLRDIPRVQRFAARPTLARIFDACSDRLERNVRIRRAHVDHGYTMTEIARHLDLHVMTISRVVRSNVGK